MTACLPHHRKRLFPELIPPQTASPRLGLPEGVGQGGVHARACSDTPGPAYVGAQNAPSGARGPCQPRLTLGPSVTCVMINLLLARLSWVTRHLSLSGYPVISDSTWTSARAVADAGSWQTRGLGIFLAHLAGRGRAGGTPCPGQDVCGLGPGGVLTPRPVRLLWRAQVFPEPPTVAGRHPARPRP